MKLVEAREILQEVDGRSHNYLKQWGLSLIREAVRTVKDRKSATQDDKLRADRVGFKIFWEGSRIDKLD